MQKAQALCIPQEFALQNLNMNDIDSQNKENKKRLKQPHQLNIDPDSYRE